MRERRAKRDCQANRFQQHAGPLSLCFGACIGPVAGQYSPQNISKKGEARIVEAATGQEIARLAHDGLVNAVAWSPNGTRIATGSRDKTARVVEAASGKEIARLAHGDRVLAVAWSPDGTRIATGSGDIIGRKGEARVVEAATGKEIARVAHDGEVNAVAWSPNGADVGPAILTGSKDSTARIWRVFPTPQALVDAAKERAARCLTQAQRAQYFLPAAPPTWCAERRLWPYHSAAWHDVWLPAQRAWLASGRQGPEPPLPKTQ